jgi:lipoate-protein ligase A
VDWEPARLRGAAEELHGREVDLSVRSVTVCEVTAPAVVLGSTQRGYDGVRRRTGGGAVWVAPGDPLWVEVVVPRGGPLWSDDVGRAFWWLGDVWVAALAEVGVVGAAVHRGGLCVTQWSREVCFGGLGSGEVTLGERKVVGLSQRRTREGALFQCAVYGTWDPAPLVSALGLPAVAVDDLREVVVGVGDRLPVLEAAFLDALVAKTP